MNSLPAPVPGDSLADYDGLRLLLSDMRLLGKLANEARYRSLDRLFGVSREDSTLATLVALGAAGAAVQRSWAKLMKGPSRPDYGDTLLAVGGVESLVGGLAGKLARDSPDLLGLVTLAVLAASAGPAVGRSWRTAHGAMHATRMRFDHRYGHIFRPFLRLPPPRTPA